MQPLPFAASPATRPGPKRTAPSRMPRAILALVGILGLAAPAAFAQGATREVVKAGPRRHIVRSGTASADRGHMRFVYGKASNPTYQELEKIFREEAFFEGLVAEIDQAFVLARDLPVRLQECEGEVNAFYDPEDRSISLCYELLEHFLTLFAESSEAETEEDFAEVGTKAIATLGFVFYHELGHALIDAYDLPATGREEDAVDQLATVLLLETWEGEDSETAMTASAEWLGISAAQTEGEHNMADEHGLDEQRFYNLVCWMYGSDPDYFGDLAQGWGLPEARAVRCPEEYGKMARSWTTLLGPHMQAQ
jgi:hypothetical protein